MALALTLASKVQVLALTVDILALKFWPLLHHCYRVVKNFAKLFKSREITPLTIGRVKVPIIFQCKYVSYRNI